MDTNLEKVHFPPKGFILDIIIQGLGVVLPRKDIQRLNKDKINNPQKVDKLIEQMLDETLSIFFTHEEKALSAKVKKALCSFLELYTEFTLTYETHKSSQKQLDYLLLKDLFIPLAADMCAVIFKDDILLLKQIKPTTKKLPIPKIFEWVQKCVPYQNEFRKTLEKKHFDKQVWDDVEKCDDESTMRKNLDKWEQGKTIPDIESINILVQYIQPDIIDQDDKKNFRNLFLFARLMQKLYMSLSKKYEQEHIDALVEHFYLLIEFYFHEPKFTSSLDLEEFIYKNYFDHINPNILNRNFYWDDYFLFITNTLYSSINKKLILKEGMKRNGMLYNMDEERAFKYMKLSLPVNVLNGTEDQSIITLLMSGLAKFVEEQKQQSFDMKNPSKWYDVLLRMSEDKAKIEYLMIYLFIILQANRNKTLLEQKECLKIFSFLENDLNINDNNPNLFMLKSRYFAYSGEPKKALEYCKKCVENGKGILGEHFTSMITEGLLLSAKCKSKRSYNFFYNHAEMIDLFKFGKLRVPADSRIYTLIDVPENITDYSKLTGEYNRYFKNNFAL